MFVRCKTSRRSVIRSAESRVVRLITSCLAIGVILWEISSLSRWRTREFFNVSPVPIRVVKRSVSRSISINSIKWLIWALIIWSSVVWVIFLIRIVGPWREISGSCGKISSRSIITVILISSLEILTSSPLLWSMICSPSFVVILIKRDFPFQQFFRFQFVSILRPVSSCGTNSGYVRLCGSNCKIVLCSVFLFGLGLLFENFPLQHWLGVLVVPIVDSSSHGQKKPSEPWFVFRHLKSWMKLGMIHLFVLSW